jgi:hypothetical protein
VSALVEAIRRPLLSWPGRLETPGTVKRRLLVVAAVMALAATGAYALTGPAEEPWTATELRDLAGLPNPPAPFAPTQSGDIRRLSPEETQQLEEIRGLIERFPVPDQFARAPGPGEDGER